MAKTNFCQHELLYFIEKANLLLSNPGRFWSSLDNENKIKFMNILKCYNSNDIIEIILPLNCNLIYKYENGIKQYKLSFVSMADSDTDIDTDNSESD